MDRDDQRRPIVPTPGQEAIDLEAAVRNALANRTDLLSAKKNIDSANVTLRSLDNQTLPTLNLQGTYRLDGRGGAPNVGPCQPADRLVERARRHRELRGADLDPRR